MDTVIPLVACSGNLHKVEELQHLLPGFALAPYPSWAGDLPEETGTTFEENARLKARAGHAADIPWVIADDSGLVVPSLGGEPGVHSARFAGESATDDDNNHLLLERLSELDGARRAHFVCALVVVSPGGEECVASGSVHGHIVHEARGENGFGYDPLFVPDGHELTFGELPPETKRAISHRANAAAALLRQLGAFREYPGQ